jgi:hypothetical protein
LLQINPVDSNRTINPLCVSLLAFEHMGTVPGILKGMNVRFVTKITIDATPEIQG